VTWQDSMIHFSKIYHVQESVFIIALYMAHELLFMFLVRVGQKTGM